MVYLSELFFCPFWFLINVQICTDNKKLERESKAVNPK